MTTKLNLTIDEKVAKKIKVYAAKKNTSVSKIAESYFKKLIEHKTKKNNFKSFVEKYAGTLKHHIPNIDEARDEYLKKNMEFKLFIDINILVDLLDGERASHKDAVNLIDMAELGVCYCYITENVLSTTAYLVRKDYDITSLISMFNHMLTFIKLLPVYTQTYQLGLRHAVNDIEDAVLYQVAIEHNLDYFVTSDIKDYKRIALPSLPIVTSAELIKLINNS